MRCSVTLCNELLGRQCTFHLHSNYALFPYSTPTLWQINLDLRGPPLGAPGHVPTVTAYPSCWHNAGLVSGMQSNLVGLMVKTVADVFAGPP